MGATIWFRALARRMERPGSIIPQTNWEEMPEGKPITKPADEDAAHFLVRTVHEFPNQVTVYEGGPMTNLALAISIDPEFAGLAKRTGVHGRQPQSAN